MIRKLLIVLLFMASPVYADTETDITAALNYFAEVWNEGDLDAIRGYYHPDFVLVTEQGSISLGQRIDDLETIAKEGEDRGELVYSQVQVKAIDPFEGPVTVLVGGVQRVLGYKISSQIRISFKESNYD